MGLVNEYECPKCGFEISETLGIGLGSMSESTSIRRQTLAGEAYPELKPLFEQYPKDGRAVKFHRLCQCPQCRKLQQSHCLIFEQEMAGEPGFLGLPKPKEICRFRPICEDCGIEMNEKNLVCPKCGTALESQSVGMWD